jgi:UDP-N-acetylglucosamine 2-epimerase (non-hydrolysing)
MKKILFIFGTRPEAIKMAPLIKYLRSYSTKYIVKVCLTAQHREMLDQVMEVFKIQSDYDLDVMCGGQNLYGLTSKCLLGLNEVIQTETPDLILVHGDTTTTMAASLASFYQQIPVGHVEAGLRTNNPYSPWPEEMNRQLTGRIASLHFAPTQKAAENLLKENVSADCITVTGNTAIDALFWVLDHHKIAKSEKQRQILITAHRRENFGNGLANIFQAIKSLSKANPDIRFVYPVHLNPNVQEPANRYLGNLKNVDLLPPQEYLPFVTLMNRSLLILTDSGGVQEEAPSLGKPVLVLRDTTERPEAVSAGTVQLVGTNIKLIIETTQKLIDDEVFYQMMSQAHNPYGDGHASEKIKAFIDKFFKNKE